MNNITGGGAAAERSKAVAACMAGFQSGVVGLLAAPVMLRAGVYRPFLVFGVAGAAAVGRGRRRPARAADKRAFFSRLNGRSSA